MSPAPPAARSVDRARLREAILDDYAGIAALQSRNGVSVRTCADWSALWTANPAYLCQGRPSPMGWVLEDQAGEIRGYLGNLPLAYSFRDRKIRAATSHSWVVDAACRVYSLDLQRRFLSQENVDLFVCTTPNAVAERVLRALDFSRAPVGKWDTIGFWITGYRRFARATLRATSARWPAVLAYPLSAGFFLGDVLRGWRLRRSREEFELCTGFDARFDDFWQEWKSQNPGRLLAERTSATLDWHFRPALARNNVWILAASRSGRIVAYAILDRQDHPVLGLKRIRFVDFQALHGFEQQLAPALSWVLRECRREGIDAVENMGCWLERFGISGTAPPYRRRAQSWQFYFKTRDRDLFHQLRDPDRWIPSSFDGDTSL